MKDYSNYKTHIQNDMKDYSGKFHFNEQLSQEGTNLIVNNESYQEIDGVNIDYVGIVRNYGVENKDTSEERSLMIDKQFNIKKGDYLKYLDEDYIITPHIDTDNPFFNTTKLTYCNQTLKWKKDNIIHEYPCVITNDSYGSKTVISGDFLSGIDTKCKITIQYNDFTKNIDVDWRFLFANSKTDIYQITDRTISMSKGIITLIAKKDVYQLGLDDLDNNIAYNSLFDNPIIEPIPIITSYTIDGSNSIKQLVEATYTINPMLDCIFSIDDLSIECKTVNIISQSNGICILKGNKSLSFEDFTLYAKDTDGNVLASKDIRTTTK